MNVINKKIISGQWALITGGSSGIGKEFAYQLAANGVNLILVSNQEHELINTTEEIKNLYDVEISYYFADLSKEDSAENLYKWCMKYEYQVDILINDAGIFTFKLFEELSKEQIRIYIDLHIRTLTNLCYLFGGDMVKRGKGYILNMSSMSCWMPMPGISMYSATKAYIRVLSRALYQEWKDKNVAVMVACPGGIATDLFNLPKNLQNLGVKLGALYTKEKFVKFALRKLFKKRKQYINGAINRIAIVAIASLPTKIIQNLKHRFLKKS